MSIELQQMLLREARQRVVNESGLSPDSPIYGIFCVPYTCITTIGDMASITKLPEYEEPEIVDANPMLSISHSGVTREVINSGDADASSWFGQRYNLYSDEETAEEILQHKTTIPLYIEQMVEIVALSGWLELADYKDAVKIQAAVDRYLNDIVQRDRFSIHSVKPPEEDIEKLKHFSKVIKIVADRAMENGHYASVGLSGLLQKFVRSQTVRAAPLNGPIGFNGENIPEHMSDLHSDPFDLRNTGAGIASGVYSRSWE